MITGKQRSYLKSLANGIDPIVLIGKEGLTQNVIKQIDETLEARELVKVKLLDSSMMDSRDTANEVCKVVRSEYVQSIGNRFVIYRQSRKNKQIDLP